MIKNISAIVMLFALAGCQSTKSPSTVDASAYGKLNHAMPARVISVRSVEVAGKTAEGATVGAIAGAAIAGKSASNGRDIKRGVVGALVGALVGAGIEKAVTDGGPAVEYVVQTDNKMLYTLVLSSTPPFALGDKVLVVQGNPASLIPDPSR